MFPSGIEPETFCVLGRCDNRYTTETCYKWFIGSFFYPIIFLKFRSEFIEILVNSVSFTALFIMRKVKMFMVQNTEIEHFLTFHTWRVFTFPFSKHGKLALSTGYEMRKVKIQVNYYIHFPCFIARKVSNFCVLKQ